MNHEYGKNNVSRLDSNVTDGILIKFVYTNQNIINFHTI